MSITSRSHEAIHTRAESRIIQSMAWWVLATGLLGYSHGKYWGGHSMVIGSIFTYMYWANPVYGLRRILDMIWIQCGLWPHLYYGWWSSVRGLYYALTAGGVLSYGISWLLMHRGNTWGATVAHMFLHMFTNLSLTVLYANPIVW